MTEIRTVCLHYLHPWDPKSFLGLGLCMDDRSCGMAIGFDWTQEGLIIALTSRPKTPQSRSYCTLVARGMGIK